MLQTATSSQSIQNIEVEVQYPMNQILASFTDERGVIRHANAAFQDVSGFDNEALIGAPHRIVRHAKMPRGLFHLFWDRLKSGQMVMAYIKNATAQGGYYWVLASVMKIADGYVSMRINPDSGLLEKVQEIYDTLLAEEERGATPDQSAASLLKHLQEHGFEDYDSFMRAALSEQFSLTSGEERFPCVRQGRIAEMFPLIDEAQALVGKITTVFSQVRGEPVNLRILAGRMEGVGAAISTISKNYEMMAGEMQQLINRLSEGDEGTLPAMRKMLETGRLSAQVSCLMVSTNAQAVNEPEQLRQGLEDQSTRLLADTQRSMADLSRAGATISSVCQQLRRRINGLDVVKLLCRVESGRMGNTDSGLVGIIERLEVAHATTDQYLSELSGIAAQIVSKSRVL